MYTVRGQGPVKCYVTQGVGGIWISVMEVHNSTLLALRGVGSWCLISRINRCILLEWPLIFYIIG